MGVNKCLNHTVLILFTPVSLISKSSKILKCLDYPLDVFYLFNSQFLLHVIIFDEQTLQ